MTPLLAESERERATLLLTGDLSPEMYAYIQKALRPNEGESTWLDVDSWKTNLVAESLILNPNDTGNRIHWLKELMPKIENVDLNSSAPPKSVLDFTVLNLASSEVVGHLNALRVYVRTDPTTQIDSFQDVLKLVSYRAVFSTVKSQEETEREILALGALFRAICETRRMAGLKTITSNEVSFLNRCLDAWCAPTASVVISCMGEFADQTNNISHLEAALQKIEPAEQELHQIYPFWSISNLADNRLINSDLAKKIFEIVRKATGEFQSFDDNQRVLLAKVSFSTELPKEERIFLVGLLRRNEEESDFTSQNAFLILAANYRFLNDAEKSELQSWFKQHAQQLKKLSYDTQAFAYLGINGFDAQEIASLLNERLLPELRVFSSSENQRPGFLNIVSDCKCPAFRTIRE